MMFWLPVFTLLLILLAIAFQDITQRKVSVFLFVLLFANNLFIQFNRCGFDETFVWQSTINALICMVQFGSALLYIRLIKGIPFTSALGAGDLLYYLCIIPVLSTPVFLVYNIISLIAVLFVLLLFRIDKNNIPLAGIQALVFAAGVISECMVSSFHFLGTCAEFFLL